MDYQNDILKYIRLPQKGRLFVNPKNSSAMKTKNIALRCPNCGHDVTSLLRKSIEEELKLQMDSGIKELQDEKIKNQRLTNQLVQEKKDLDILVQKQVELKLGQATSEIRKKAHEDSQMTILEYQKLIQDLRKKLADVKQHAEQSSQQLRGEVQELFLEKMLKETFPHDDVIEIGKGVSGADIQHIIKTSSGTILGSILIESKRTRTFGGAKWIKKLKEDNLKLGEPADLLVIISEALPKEINQFGIIDDVWVCHPTMAQLLSIVLRYTIVKVSEVELSHPSPGSRDELIAYISGKEFQSLLQDTLEGFSSLMKNHNEEKAKMQRLWKGREKMIEKMLSNTISLYGSLQAHTSDKLPRIESLEFDSLRKSA